MAKASYSCQSRSVTWLTAVRLEHLDPPLVQRPVVDHHLQGGVGELPHPLGRRAGPDDHIHPPDQTP